MDHEHAKQNHGNIYGMMMTSNSVHTMEAAVNTTVKAVTTMIDNHSVDASDPGTGRGGGDASVRCRDSVMALCCHSTISKKAKDRQLMAQMDT